MAKHVVLIAYSFLTLELCLLVTSLLERHLKVHSIEFRFEMVALVTARAGAQIRLLDSALVAITANLTDVHELSKYKLSLHCIFSATLSVS